MNAVLLASTTFLNYCIFENDFRVKFNSSQFKGFTQDCPNEYNKQ